MRKIFCAVALTIFLACALSFARAEAAADVSALWESAQIAETELRYREALELYEQVLEAREEELGAEHPDTIEALNAAARVHLTLGNYNKALKRYETALAVREKTGIELDVAGSLLDVAECYWRLNDPEKAKGFAARSLEIRERKLGRHPDTAASLHRFGSIYKDLGDIDKAMELYDQALAMKKETLGADHQETAHTLNNIACIYQDDLKDYAKAKEFYEEALMVYEKSVGKEHPDTAMALRNLGNTYQSLENYNMAKEYHERALAIYLKLYGEEHADTAWSLNNLGYDYRGLGDYAKALECDERALAIRLKLFGEEHADTVHSLNNLGVDYRALGDYIKAAECDKRAIAIRLKILSGEEIYETAISLNNLGVDFRSLGDYAKAVEYDEQALAVLSKLYGESHRSIAMSLSNLGVDYYRLGDYEQAEKYHERSLAIKQKLLGTEHPSTARALVNMGIFYTDTGDYAKAEEYIKRALIIQMKLFGRDGEDIAQSFYNLGKLFNNMQLKASAVFCMKQAVNIVQLAKKRISKEDKDLQESFLHFNEYLYQGLADLLAEQGRILEAQQVLAMLDEKEFFDFIGAGVMAAEQVAQVPYTKREKEYADLLDEIAQIKNNLDLASREFESLIVDLKNKLKERVVDVEREVVVSHPELEQRHADRLREIKEQQLQLELYREKEELVKKMKNTSEDEWDSSDDAKRLAEIRSDLDLASREFESFIGDLKNELKSDADPKYLEEFAGMKLNAAPALQDTLRKMGNGAVLLNIVPSETRVAIMLTTPATQIHFEFAISREELLEKISTFRKCLTQQRSDILPVAKELYRILLSPAEKFLKDAKAHTLMFNLCGPLRYIPMAALHDGKEWLAQKYAIVTYTEATIDLLSKPDVREWQVAAFGVTKEHPGFEKLSAVEGELKSIVREEGVAESDNGIIPGRIMLNEKFTKSAFINALDRDAPVVHVASHFQYESGTAGNSFLLLGDGKHLTLDEISNESFSFGKVDQLTLSACETAMGTGKGAGREMEGFALLVHMKGAKSILATLWSVADASTGIFMPRYYELLQKDGMTKAEALRQAQTEFIKSTAKPVVAGKNEKSGTVKGDGDEPTPTFFPGYSHPYYWAPFVLMGNWL